MKIDGTGKAEDITEGLNFMEVLRDALPCGVVAVNDQLQITVFDSEAENLVRQPASQVLKGPLSQLPAPLQAAIRETFETGRAVRDRQVVFCADASHNEVVLRVSTTPIGNGHGKVNSVVMVLNNFSSARKLAKNMRHLDRLASIGTLSASMAHEIKNAFVPIKTFVQLLLKQNKDAELAEVVNREMRRVDSIVSQMLRFAGPAKPIFATVHVHEVLDQALLLLQHQLEGRKIALHKSYRASPPTVRGDAYQLEQVFINLFLNAFEAMGPNGQLRVATNILELPPPSAKPSGPGPSQLQIAIQDTGTGILAEHLNRLFEPFFTTKPNGTGLGLAITRRIVQEHGGTISVDSEVNQGSTFKVLLPWGGMSR